MNKQDALFLLILSFLCDFLIAGSIFGWSDVEDILRREGAWSTSSVSHRQLQLALIFYSAVVCNSIGALVSGETLDRFGPKFNILVYGCIYLLGGVIFASAFAWSDAAFAAGFSLMGFGSVGVLNATWHVPNAFPKFRTYFLAAIPGFVAGSSSIFLFLKLVYLNSSRTSFPTIMASYIAVCLGILVVTSVMMPRRALASPSADLKAFETESFLQEFGGGDDGYGAHDVVPVEPVALMSLTSMRKRKVKTHTGGPASRPSLMAQLKSRKCLMLSCFLVLNSLNAQWYLFSIEDQLSAMGDTGFYVNLFEILYPLGAVVCFGSGLIFKIGFHWACAVTSMLLVVATGLLVTNVLVLSPLSFVFYICGRNLMYSCYYTIAAFFFGTFNYGRITGLGACVASAISTLAFLFVFLSQQSNHFAGFQGTNALVAVISCPVIYISFKIRD